MKIFYVFANICALFTHTFENWKHGAMVVKGQDSCAILTVTFFVAWETSISTMQ